MTFMVERRLQWMKKVMPTSTNRSHRRNLFVFLDGGWVGLLAGDLQLERQSTVAPLAAVACERRAVVRRVFLDCLREIGLICATHSHFHKRSGYGGAFRTYVAPVVRTTMLSSLHYYQRRRSPWSLARIDIQIQ